MSNISFIVFASFLQLEKYRCQQNCHNSNEYGQRNADLGIIGEFVTNVHRLHLPADLKTEVRGIDRGNNPGKFEYLLGSLLTDGIGSWWIFYILLYGYVKLSLFVENFN